MLNVPLQLILIDVASIFTAFSVVLVYQGMNEKKGVLEVFKENFLRAVIITILIVVVKNLILQLLLR